MARWILAVEHTDCGGVVEIDFRAFAQAAAQGGTLSWSCPVCGIVDQITQAYIPTVNIRA
jgi:hypothetical protein